ncbi:MAG: DPP IV N-terminal domain-containing protein, partial [Bacteroidia bacterium]|nr:DPP IV N-terminal domain-containing protein [Bacteroidia bacterium]
MKKIIFLFVAISQFAFAQTKLFTMEEAVVLQRSTLAPAKLKQLMWQKNVDNYSFIEKRGNEDALVVYSASSSKELYLFNFTQLNAALTAASLNTVKAFPAIQWMNDKQFTFEADKKLISVDITTKKAKVEASRDLGEEATNKDVADKTNYVAFTVKNNLFVFDGKEKLIVTNDADENIVNGQTVHRDEFGIHKGTYWSPKGNLLAFYRMDQTMVTDYPVIDWAPRPAKNVNIKYPMAGDKSHEVTVG